MTGWIIAGSIVLVLFLLLLISVKLKVSYHFGGLTAKAGFLKFYFRIYPLKGEKAKKAEIAGEKAAEEVKKKAKAKDKIDFSLIKIVVESSKKSIRTIFRHLVFYDLQLSVIVGEEDAAACAISYGRLCSYVYGGIAASRNLLRLNTKKVELYCDYSKNEWQIDFDAAVRIRVLFLFGAALSILFRIFVKTIRNNMNR